MVFSYGIRATCDDVIFIASYNNKTIGDEVQWPNQEEQTTVAQHMPKFQGCIKWRVH
jgi:hypothetical protein